MIALKTIDGVVDIEMVQLGASYAAECSLSKEPDGCEDAHLSLSLQAKDMVRAVVDLDKIMSTYPVFSEPLPRER